MSRNRKFWVHMLVAVVVLLPAYAEITRLVSISFASSSETSCVDTHTNLSSARTRRLAINQRSMHGDPHQKPNRLHNAPANFSDFARGERKDLQEIKWLTRRRRRRLSRCKKPVCVSSFSTWFSCYFHDTTTTTIKKNSLFN
jgi:hypothetical protein